MMRRPLTLSALVLLALALAAAPASATTHVTRPAAWAYQTGWTTTGGADLAAVLDDDVLQPAAPSTAGDYAEIAAKGSYDIAVSLAPPSLLTGETPTFARLVFYAQVGTSTTMSGALWWNSPSGSISLASVPLPAGSPAGWYATAPVAVTADQLPALYGDLHADASGGGTPPPTRAYAMYLEVETTGGTLDPTPVTDPPPTSDPAPTPDPQTGTPTFDPTPIADPTPTSEPQPSANDSVDAWPAAPVEQSPAPRTEDPASAAGEDQPGEEKPGKPDKHDAAAPPIAATLPNAATPLLFSPSTGAVPIELGCPALAQGPCRGKVALRLAGATTSGRRARMARCARGCRVIGEGDFKIAAGAHKQVRVKVKKSARKAFRGRRAVAASMTVTTVGANGRKTVTTRKVSIRVRG